MKSILTALSIAGLLSAVAPSVQAKPAAEAKAQAKTQAKAGAPTVFTSAQKEGTKATCPITGEEFTIAKNTAHAEYKGKYVYFCCPGCRKAFDKDPAKYTK